MLELGLLHDRELTLVYKMGLLLRRIERDGLLVKMFRPKTLI